MGGLGRGGGGGGAGSGLRWSLAAPTFSLPFFAPPTFAPSAPGSEWRWPKPAGVGGGVGRRAEAATVARWGCVAQSLDVYRITWLRRAHLRGRGFVLGSRFPGCQGRASGLPPLLLAAQGYRGETAGVGGWGTIPSRPGGRDHEGASAAHTPVTWGRGTGLRLDGSAAGPEKEPGHRTRGAGTHGWLPPLPAGGALATPETVRAASAHREVEFPQKTREHASKSCQMPVCAAQSNSAFSHLIITTHRVVMAL